MMRPVRKTELLLVMAVINAGCAQMSGTYIPGDGSAAGSTAAAVDWPTPALNNTPAPIPSEPILLPQAMMPAEQQIAPEPPRRAVLPRRAVVAPRAAVAPVAAAPSGPRDVWQRVRNGFQMAPNANSLVSDWENYYASRPDYFARMIDKIGRASCRERV